MLGSGEEHTDPFWNLVQETLISSGEEDNGAFWESCGEEDDGTFWKRVVYEAIMSSGEEENGLNDKEREKFLDKKLLTNIIKHKTPYTNDHGSCTWSCESSTIHDRFSLEPNIRDQSP
ncbi:hypothetical protein VNO77_07865 [Canavalia gladiata]|uniref:Uncharacterized protein n=1 Tax=Canavalia gladiata TaxID=3824 RepID=A0AAN9M7Z5_CANGL